MAGIDKARLKRWCGEVGWERLVNRSSTTFRGLDPADRENLDERRAIALMLAHPTLIRRPVVEGDAASPAARALVALADRLAGSLGARA